MKLSIEEFGDHLLESGDLDPIYLALVKAQLDPIKLKRWLLAYWTFYHAGVASYLADSDHHAVFWDRFGVAAVNSDLVPTPFGQRWPRGHERRHMRGKNAMACWEGLRTAYFDAPERFVDVCVPGPTTCREVVRRVRGHVQFGPWIGFKIADMADRVLGVPISFENAEVFIFDDPKKAALMFWRQSTGQPENAVPKDEMRVLETVVQHLTEKFKRHSAPPRHERPVGLQEVETILCKWKSHLNGFYPLYNDIAEIRGGLVPWLPHSETARAFHEAMPETPL